MLLPKVSQPASRRGRTVSCQRHSQRVGPAGLSDLLASELRSASNVFSPGQAWLFTSRGRLFSELFPFESLRAERACDCLQSQVEDCELQARECSVLPEACPYFDQTGCMQRAEAGCGVTFRECGMNGFL